MINKGTLTLFYSPQTRSLGALTLLEELGADYKIKYLNMKEGEHKKPEFLAINPMGKVPTIVHEGSVVTEQVAIYIYLADLFAEANLAPPLNHPQRGPYLRWMAFYGSSFEPAVVDKAMKREPGRPAMTPYGDYETMLKTFTDHLSKNTYFLGEKFSAVDVLWGSALNWMLMFKLVPEMPVIKKYVEQFAARPSQGRVKEIENKYLKS
jgi:glutathione S-transferase